MTFGLFYANNIWYVVKVGPKFTWALQGTLISSCTNIYISDTPDKVSIYPIKDLEIKYNKFSYKSLCKSCRKKHNLTKADIIQHIINVKLGVKIEDLV